jgi:hypothetical protein
MGEAFIVRKGGGKGVSFTTYDDLETISFVNIPTGGSSDTDNDFIYVGGSPIRKYNKNNLIFVNNSNRNGGSIRVDDDFVFITNETNRNIEKLFKGNLEYIENSVSYNGVGLELTIDANFVYVVGSTNIGSADNRTVKKYHKENLVFVGNTNNYGQNIRAVAVDDDFIYAGGISVLTVKKWHKGNLVFVGETNSYGDTINKIALDNDFLYVIGFGNSTANQDIKKYHKNNLAFVGNSNSFSTTFAHITSIALDNNFVYITGNLASGVRKFYKGNLAFVGETELLAASQSVLRDNDFIYTTGGTRMQKFSADNNVVDSAYPLVFIENRKYYLRGEGI